MKNKICTTCKEEKKINQFHKDRTNKDGRDYTCKDCNKKANRKYNFKFKNNNLKCRYGITLQEYNKLLKKQNGVCAICKKTEINRKLSVDHNHETGKIRGLLCQKCNAGIGMFQDNIKLFQNVIGYLRKSR